MDRSSSKTYYSEEVSEYLRQLSRKYSLDYIIECIDSISNLKILVVGEAIIDDYQFGSVIGKSAKEPIIVLKHLKEERYAGGALAVANHLSSFCKDIGLFTMLGEKKSYRGFIEKHLHKNVKPLFFYKKNAPTIVKKRFLENSTYRKLLELYYINDSELSDEQSKESVRKLTPLLSRYDLVLCADFGHGFLNHELRNALIKNSGFLSVNTQANAGNFGYHVISLYPKADYVCLDEREIRLECRKRNGEFEEVAKSIFERIRCRNMIATHGANGCIGYAKKEKIKVFKSPSLAIKETDKVGAGDALWAISSPLVYSKVPMDMVCFIGNCVGALAIDILGNKKSITKKDLIIFITNIFNQK